MSQGSPQWVRVFDAGQLEATGRAVVAVAGHAIAFFRAEGGIFAVDNRCPHMGFPLSRGSVRDGLLTCHWHHARFDLCSGGTLDPFADNVRSYPVKVEQCEVFVDVSPRDDGTVYWQRRLVEGLEQSLSLVTAKAVLALGSAGCSDGEIVALGGAHGLHFRDAGWGSGMTILSALANVLPELDGEDRALALTHGLVRVAQDCAGRPPRFAVEPLPGADVSAERLATWFRRAVEVRNEDGAERTLRTAIASGAGVATALDMLYAAATDHFFIDDGHTLDFITKAAEYVDHVGAEHAQDALSSLVRGLCRAQRSEEQYSWRYPTDLVALVEPALAELPDLKPVGNASELSDAESLAAVLLGEDPAASVEALRAELHAGVAPVALARTIAYAAALRLARFPTSNEFGDWDTVHNTWSSCHALLRALERAPSTELTRGLFHAAMALYLDRFLNVPAARLPEETLARRGVAGPALLQELRECFDRQQQVDEAAALVDAYLAAGEPDGELIATLGHLMLREDAGFHMYQTFEAGARLYRSLVASSPGAARRVLVGVARYLAAHSPTSRELNQTARIALRLHRGEDLFAEPEGQALAAAD